MVDRCSDRRRSLLLSLLRFSAIHLLDPHGSTTDSSHFAERLSAFLLAAPAAAGGVCQGQSGEKAVQTGTFESGLSEGDSEKSHRGRELNTAEGSCANSIVNCNGFAIPMFSGEFGAKG